MTEKREKPTTPGSVIQIDTLLMRTRWGNWVSDAGFLVEDAEIAGEPFMLVLDSAEQPRFWFEATDAHSTETWADKRAEALNRPSVEPRDEWTLDHPQPSEPESDA